VLGLKYYNLFWNILQLIKMSEPGLLRIPDYETGASSQETIQNPTNDLHVKDSRNSYQYASLEGENAIRLLIIQPKPYILQGRETLQCDIVHTKLDGFDNDNNELAYTAISYYWGDSSMKVPIRVGDQVLFIGHNLWSALYHLRTPKALKVVWADGICINQTDVDERNHQVHQMCDIYRTARSTVIFLGVESGNTCKSAWNFLERQSNARTLQTQYSGMNTFLGDIEDVEIDVLSRPWFQRVWVFQEVVVSRKIEVHCGWRVVPWDDFCKTILVQPRIEDRYGWSLSKKPLMKYLLDMFQARCAFLIESGFSHLLPAWWKDIKDNKTQGNHILTNLSRARRLESSDARDKIFALLGVSTGIGFSQSLITPDYKKSTRQVYMDFAKYLLLQEANYDVLSHCGTNPHFADDGSSWNYHMLGQFGTDPRYAGDVPSWTLDWRVLPMTGRNILSVIEQDLGYQQRSASNSIMFYITSNGNKLCCIGESRGVVKAVSTKIYLEGRDEDSFHNIRKVHKKNKVKMYSELLKHWSQFPWRHWQKRTADSEFFAREFPKLMNLERIKGVSKHLNTLEKKPSPKHAEVHVVERHLIDRSRKTAFGSSDESLVALTITDPNSIIDERAFALYSPIIKSNNQLSPIDLRIALVPVNTKAGDIIVSLNGGRVPFIMREFPRIYPHFDEEPAPVKFSAPQPRIKHRGALIGECLFDHFSHPHKDGTLDKEEFLFI
jgi:hypothetical protein